MLTTLCPAIYVWAWPKSDNSMHQSQGKIDEKLADNKQLNYYIDFWKGLAENNL